MALNRTRADYLATFQAMLDDYNAGSKNIQLYFEELVAFAQELDAETQRGVRERLSEEELAVFDLLTRPGPHLTAKETEQVKGVARDLLARLKTERLVLDWRQKQQARARVRVVIDRALEEGLPRIYALTQVKEKVEVIYQHVYEAYAGEGKSIYSAEAVSDGAYRYR